VGGRGSGAGPLSRTSCQRLASEGRARPCMSSVTAGTPRRMRRVKRLWSRCATLESGAALHDRRELVVSPHQDDALEAAASPGRARLQQHRDNVGPRAPAPPRP